MFCTLNTMHVPELQRWLGIYCFEAFTFGPRLSRHTTHNQQLCAFNYHRGYLFNFTVCGMALERTATADGVFQAKEPPEDTEC
jgi:hypothetical protein